MPASVLGFEMCKTESIMSMMQTAIPYTKQKEVLALRRVFLLISQ